jgi:hypothetical protein
MIYIHIYIRESAGFTRGGPPPPPSVRFCEIWLDPLPPPQISREIFKKCVFLM